MKSMGLSWENLTIELGMKGLNMAVCFEILIFFGQSTSCEFVFLLLL